MSKNDEVLEELKQIRELLTPPTPPPPPKGIINEFKAFLEKYKIVGLAVAFIMGIYAGAVIKALVDDLIMPIVEFFLPADTSWESLTVGVFRVGHFLGTVITFVIVALVIFLIVKLTSEVKINKITSIVKNKE